MYIFRFYIRFKFLFESSSLIFLVFEDKELKVSHSKFCEMLREVSFWDNYVTDFEFDFSDNHFFVYFK